MKYIFLLLVIIITSCSRESDIDVGLESFVCYGKNIEFEVYQPAGGEELGGFEYGIFLKKQGKSYKYKSKCDYDVCSIEKLPPFQKYSIIAKEKNFWTGDYLDNDKEVEFETYLDADATAIGGQIISYSPYYLDGHKYLYSNCNDFIYPYSINKTGNIDFFSKFNKHDFSYVVPSENSIWDNIDIKGTFINDMVLVDNSIYVSVVSSSIVELYEISADTGAIINKNTISLSELSLVPLKLLFADKNCFLFSCSSDKPEYSNKNIILKIKKSDYSIDKSFGNNGLLALDNIYPIQKTFQFNNYIFIAGYNGSFYVQKFDINTGLIDSSYANNGTYSIDMTYRKDGKYKINIVLENDDLYISADNGLSETILEKRSAITGNLVTGFGENGKININKLKKIVKKENDKINFLYLYNDENSNYKITFSFKAYYNNYVLVKYNYHGYDENIYLSSLISIDKNTGKHKSVYGAFNACLSVTDDIIVDDDYLYAVSGNICKIRNFMKEEK